MSTERANALHRRLTRQRGLSLVDSSLTGMTSLDEAFRRSVARHPERAAIRHEGVTLSYRDLDRRVAELAGALAVDPSAPVGILLDRSADMVAAALAVIRVGASYVPIDPATPPARVAAILADACPSVVITSSALADLVDAPVLPVDGPLPTGGSTSPSTWDGRAYVIFTSGTTGRPKGVQVTHGNLLRLFTATEEQYGFGSSDVWTLFHSFAFDFSVWEMWGPLLYGGCLVIVPKEVAQDPVSFRGLLRTERVTVLSQTPTAFTQLVAEDARHDDRLPLRWVVFGGEALHFSDLRPWVAKYGDTTPALANMYGITETTVHASFRRVRRGDLALTGSHIGTPLSDLDFRLVDDALAPVPDGTTGEIVVRGPGVATGYLNRPDLTAERFVSVAGTRGYRSGDLATRLPNGEYVYHGRKDDQVKIRGFRIELGEVEGAVRALPGVAQAAVVAQGAGLVAYVVSSLPPALLRQGLAKVLPEYMIPARFEPIPALPVTGNGKLDRAALPTLVRTPPQATTEPSDPVTTRVHDIAAVLLDTPTVAPAANFFELGGHSLLATRFLAEVRAAFGITVPLRDFLRHPTLAAVAAAVRRGTAVETSGPLIRLHDGGRGAPAVGIPGILGFGLSFAQLSAAMPDRPWYAVDLREVVSARPGELTVPVLVSDLAGLVAEATAGRPVHLVGHSYGGSLAHYLVPVLRERGCQVESLTLLDALEPRDLAAELAAGRDHRVWEFLTTVASVFPSVTTRWPVALASTEDPVTKAQDLLGEDAAALFPRGLSAALADHNRLADVAWPTPNPTSCRTLLVTATTPPTAANQASNWLPLLPGGLERREIAASHVGMVQAPHAQELATLLTSFLADVESAPTERKAS